MASQRFSKQVGVLWLREKENEDGSTLRYFSGYIDNGIHGNIPIVIFRIRDKQNPNGPDYRMLLCYSLVVASRRNMGYDFICHSWTGSYFYKK